MRITLWLFTARHQGMLMRTSTAGAIACALVVTIAPSASATVPVGGEFVANTYTTGNQIDVDVSSAADGSFVVVWTSASDQDGSSYGVFGQRYDSQGNALGSEFQVNTYTPSLQYRPSVAADADASFIVTWTSYPGNDGSGEGVFARRYGSAGTPVGTEFQVNTYTTGAQWQSDVVPTVGGSFVIVWSGVNDGHYSGIFGQLFDASGNPAGSEFQINTYTTNSQNSPQVASAPDGTFIVVWTSSTQDDGSEPGVYGQRYDSAGIALGTEFQANTYTTGYQWFPSTAMAQDGSFVVAWKSTGQNDSIIGRRYDSAGNPLDAEFEIFSSNDDAIQSITVHPSVSSAADGSFMVVTHRADFIELFPEVIGEDHILARRFDNGGNPIGTEFHVTSYLDPDIDQADPVVAVAPDSGFVVTWEREGEVVGQRYANPICGSAPEPDVSCRLADPTGAGKSTLLIQNDSAFRRDRIRWKWAKGAATDTSDFMSPDTDTATYRVCVYDGSSGTQPLLERDLTAGGVTALCNGKLCWRVLGSSTDPKGFKYTNKDRVTGITAATLKGGAAGKSSVQIKGRGFFLTPPDTAALDPNVVVQLLIDDGITTECFKTSFPGTSGAGAIRTQSATHFSATGP